MVKTGASQKREFYRRFAKNPIEGASYLNSLRIEDASHIVISLSKEELSKLLPYLKPELIAETVRLCLQWDVSPTRILDVLSNKRFPKVLESLEVDEIADLIETVGEDSVVGKTILGFLPESRRKKVRQILRFAPGTAGAIMNPNVVVVSSKWKVGDVLNVLPAILKTKRIESANYIYVTDKNQRLIGVLSLKELLLSSPDERIENVMQRDVIKVRCDADQEEVAELVSKYDLLAVPVVDENDKLLGIVTVDDVINIISDESNEDMMMVLGMGEETAPDVAMPIFHILKIRLPWLGVIMGFEFLSAALLKYFQHNTTTQSAEMMVVLSFIPMVMALNGTVGNQSGVVVLRGMIVGWLDSFGVFKTLLRQTLVGFSFGVLSFFLIYLVLGVIFHNPELGLAIGVAFMITMPISSFLGSLYPLVLKKMGADPAVSLTPLISGSSDVLSILLYATVSTLLLRLFSG